MLSRPNAPFYEAALVCAIEERNETEAINLIHNIQHYTGAHKPSLTTIDSQGINFLQYAMHQRLRLTTKTLLESGEFDTHQQILFSKNSNGQTLICQAAELGYNDILHKIHSLADALFKQLPVDEQSDSPGYHLWQQADNKLNTPLHYAAINNNTHLCGFLISLASAEPETDMRVYINQRNDAGETPLHIAVETSNPLNTALINQLIGAGADLKSLNKRRLSPFGMLCQRSDIQQLELLRGLDEVSAKLLLDHYKQHLATHPDDEKSRSVYFAYMSTKSLKDITIAHLELNPKVPLRTTYNAAHNPSPENLLGTAVIDAKVIEDPELAKALPLYCARLLANEGIFAFSKRPEVINTRLLKQDIQTLDELIEKIDRNIQDWTARKPFPKYKLISVLAPTLSWLAWGAAESALIYAAVTESTHPTRFLYDGEEIQGPDISFHPNITHYECHRDYHGENARYRAYQHNPSETGSYKEFTPIGHCDLSLERFLFWASTSIGFVGAVGNGIFSCIACCSLWDKVNVLTIPHTEWQDVMQMIGSMTDKLSKFHDTDLPTDGINITILIYLMGKLNQDKTQSEAITIFTNILSQLKKIRSDMILRKKPFSRFEDLIPEPQPELEEVFIDEQSESDSANEHLLTEEDETFVPLLQMRY